MLHGSNNPPPHPPLMELEGVDPQATSVFRAFMRTLHLHRQALLKSLAEQGRSFSQVGCLRVLANNDGMSQRDVADTLHLSRPSVTTMLHAMEEQGLVTRRADERDRRLTRVYLTDAGRELEHEMHAGISDYIKHTVGALAPDEQATLERLLNKLSDNIAQSIDRSDDRRRRHGRSRRMIELLKTYLKPYRKQIALVVVLVTMQAIGNLYLPNLNADIINNGVAKGDTAYIIQHRRDHARRRPCCSAPSRSSRCTGARRRRCRSGATSEARSSGESRRSRRPRSTCSGRRR